MLTNISSNQDYLDFLNSNFSSLSVSDIKRYSDNNKLKSILWQLRHLNLDPIHDILLSLYSNNFGRPAIDPSILIRSFILMLKLDYTSIDKWCSFLKSDSLYQYMIGTSSPPSMATHYDFINRITFDNPDLSTLFPKGKNTKAVKASLVKNEKWDNFTGEDTRSLCAKYKDGADCDKDRVTFVLESIFNIVAVNHSIDLGLINKNGIFCGDGSCLHCHSNPNGNRVPQAGEQTNCYRYTAPDADWGWDSDLGVWYFGYTIFNISTYNPIHKLDLPVYLSLGYASTHDAITSITATARLLHMNNTIKPGYMCFDSAMDAYEFYAFLRKQNIIPIIDWNKRYSDPVNPFVEYEGLDPKTGVPICAEGHLMIRDGYDKSKMATKYRCPVAKGVIDSCPLWGTCSSSSYGRVIKTYDKTDFKLFGPVPYHSNKWFHLYKNRTCTERINNRILNHYNLQNSRFQNRSKNFFFLIMAGICIHMDAWHKVKEENLE